MGKARLFFAYIRRRVLADTVLTMVCDRRQAPDVSTFTVVVILFVTGLLRIRIFNALEPKLEEATFQRAVEGLGEDGQSSSVETLGCAFARMDPETARKRVVQTLRTAERNKVFRTGLQSGLRFAAIDGWQPFSSRHRHCPGCLTREVHVGPRELGQTVTEYYHAFVVALYLDVCMDLAGFRNCWQKLPTLGYFAELYCLV